MAKYEYFHYHIFIRGRKSQKPTLYSGLLNSTEDQMIPELFRDLIASAFHGKIDGKDIIFTSNIVDHDGRYKEFVRKAGFKCRVKGKYNRTGYFMIVNVDFKKRTFYSPRPGTYPIEASYRYSGVYSHVTILEERNDK